MPRDISDLMTTVTMRRHLIRLASVPFTSLHLEKFGWVLFERIFWLHYLRHSSFE